MFNLPLANQRVFQVLVLVPIGALIISILHQIIGLKTFGTFTPILIALSFRQTGLLVGIPLFFLVVIIGLLIRGYLNRLQLLIVPRLAAILTATVLIMAFLAIIMGHLNINLGLSISLFPIVILAMTIERAAVTWEEEGAKETIIAGLKSGDLQYHIYNILSGMFSLGGQSDNTIIEYTVQFAPVFAEIAYQGVPDIRVIIYRGVPAMAMLRLPTRPSDGKANLHRGGVGVGIDLATGITLAGIQNDRYIDNHPETGHSLRDRQIPHWQSILEMAAKLGDKTEFGYLGVDIVLDEEKGPLLLEINARPGLAIQIANREGLIGRLEAIDSSLPKLSGIQEKIAFAQKTFAVAPL